MQSFLKIIFISIISILILSGKKDNQTTVFLMGDSTCAEKLENKRPETGWGEKIAQYFNNDVCFKNYAKNGRSTKTFISEGLWDSVYNQLKKDDYVFIQFGHNDASTSKAERYTPPQDFMNNEKIFIEKIREKGAIPVLLTPVCRRRWDDNNFYDSHGIYSNLTRAVAAETKTTLLDAHLATMALLVQLGEEESAKLFLHCQVDEYLNYPEGKEDNTHFNDYGATIAAGLIANLIRNSDLALKKQLQESTQSHIR
ncbi:MAG: rhamnogalacturonan acetylesterase [Bacteroidales bacterium]|jgi:lysophospholipase L1-like esterase|nr:rhamnogalacturonan acetylesterase [Bacteroidales bacterium]